MKVKLLKKKKSEQMLVRMDIFPSCLGLTHPGVTISSFSQGANKVK